MLPAASSAEEREAIITIESGCFVAMISAAWYPRPVVPPVISIVDLKLDIMLSMERLSMERIWWMIDEVVEVCEVCKMILYPLRTPLLRDETWKILVVDNCSKVKRSSIEVYMRSDRPWLIALYTNHSYLSYYVTFTPHMLVRMITLMKNVSNSDERAQMAYVWNS